MRQATDSGPNANGAYGSISVDIAAPLLPGGPLVAVVAAGWGRGVVRVDLLAAGREDVPLPAELIDALSCRVPGLLVCDEVVEGMAAVGDLGRAVGPGGRPEQCTGSAGAALGSAGRGHRRPGLRAGVVAGGVFALVRFEEVDDPPGTVGQHLTDIGAGDGYRRSAVARGRPSRCTWRRAGRRVAIAARSRSQGQGRGRTHIDQSGFHLSELSLMCR